MEKDWWKEHLSEDMYELSLGDRDIENLKDVTLPQKLQRLFLSGKILKSLEGIDLPQGLKLLNLKGRYLTSLEGVTLPDGLQTLYLDYTSLTSLKGVTLPQGLQELYLLDNTNPISLKSVTLPQKLHGINLSGTNLTTLEGITLPQKLQQLSLFDTNLTSLKGVMLPQGLQLLNLNSTKLTSLEGVTLPQGLQWLYLDSTDLTSLPNTIRDLKELKVLDISRTKLTELPDWLPELGLPFTRGQKSDGIRLYNTTVKGVDMSIFDQSQETILEWFKEYSKAKQQKKTSILFLGYSHGVVAHKDLKLSNYISVWSDDHKKWHFDLLDESAWEHRHVPEYLHPRFGFEPIDFGKYYYPDRFPEHFAPLPGEAKGPVRWLCGRYTPSGCFDNEDWNPKTYRPAYEARKPIYLEEVPEDDPEVEEPAKPLNEVKVVFLGDGGAGKSHTIARLLKDGVQTEDFPNISTPGIVIKDKTYPIGGRDVKVHFWDFGGQEILHSMHRMFLTERTLYVLVLNVRDGTQNDRARYWLYNLRSFANGAPVLLVLNQMDMNENASLNESDLRKLYPNLAGQVVKLSTLNYSVEEFQEQFIDVLRRQIGSMDILAFPFTAAWSRLKEKLQNMKENYIFGDVFRDFCEECGVTGSDTVRRDLLNWFSDLGVSFCYSGSASLEDYVVLRPDWITNAIYIVLFNKVEAARNGQVSHETIYRMLSSKDAEKYRRTVTTATYKPHEVDYVLKVFRKFRLSFLAEDGVEFLPMLCDENAAPISDAYEQDPDVLEFRMNYEYLPDNVIHRLMVERRRELQLSQVWKYGGLFVNDCTGLSAVVKTEGNLLRIMVHREDSQCQPQLYLNALKKDIERINAEMGLTALGTDVAYKHGGSVEYFDYEVLLASLEAGLPHVVSLKTKKPVLIQDILKQSGHSADKAQDKLLTDIVHACEMLQDDRTTWNKSEDERTIYIRNLLRSQKYIAQDQSRGGVSTGGEQAGELDLDIRLEPDVRWTIFEALNLSGSTESRLKYWDAHLDKLLDNYNSTGCPFLFHVTYLSCSKDSFTKHCIAFDEHIRWYAPAKFSVSSHRPTDPLVRLGLHQSGFRRVMECVYDCGGIPMTVYHIFVRIGE